MLFSFAGAFFSGSRVSLYNLSRHNGGLLYRVSPGSPSVGVPGSPRGCPPRVEDFSFAFEPQHGQLPSPDRCGRTGGNVVLPGGCPGRLPRLSVWCDGVASSDVFFFRPGPSDLETPDGSVFCRSNFFSFFYSHYSLNHLVLPHDLRLRPVGVRDHSTLVGVRSSGVSVSERRYPEVTEDSPSHPRPPVRRPESSSILSHTSIVGSDSSFSVHWS